MLILTTRRNCQRGKLPACRAVIKRNGNAGECEVGQATSSSFAVSSSSFYLFTIMVLRPSHLLHKVLHTISSRCIACRFHHCLRSQQLNLLQLTSTLLTFDQRQYLQYQHVEFLISSSSSHRAGMRPDLVLDDYQINARWHRLYISVAGMVKYRDQNMNNKDYRIG